MISLCYYKIRQYCWIAIGVQLYICGVSIQADARNWELVGTPPTAITIHAEPIPVFNKNIRDQTRFGLLEYRGGLSLTSQYKEFGGLSAIRLMPDLSRFISLSDHGRWLQGRIVYNGKEPVGIDDAIMAPMLGPDGQPLAARGWHDTESIADDNGTLYVGIERVNQIVRFRYDKDGLRARGEPIAVPAGVKTLPANLGLESLVFIPRDKPLGGTLLAISERGLDSSGNIRAFLIGGPTPGTFAVRRSAKFDISDASLLPNGDLLVLERSVDWSDGLQVQIRRIVVADIRPGAVVDGVSIFNADLRTEIDNLEGIDAKEMSDGQIILTLVSDNNFSPLQRTQLLQFKLVQ